MMKFGANVGLVKPLKFPTMALRYFSTVQSGRFFLLRKQFLSLTEFTIANNQLHFKLNYTFIYKITVITQHMLKFIIQHNKNKNRII